jgi:replicative DNA helicase
MEPLKFKYSNNSVLPNNFLAEQAILNILLTSPSLVKNIVTELKPNTFYFEPHRILYETIFELFEKNEFINLTRVITKLQDKNCLQRIGGIERIIEIINHFEDYSDISEYIVQLNDKYLRRLIIELGKEFIGWGYTTSEDLDLILDKMEHAVYSLSQEKITQKVYSVAEIIDDIFLEMKEKIKNQTTPGLKTSFKDLDAILQGFQKSDLIVIAGRPSMVKTAFSLNLGKNIVEKYKVPLVIFTLEMSRQQIIYRFLSTSSKIDTKRFKSGKMRLTDWDNLGKAMQNMSSLPIFIDDNANITVTEIRSKLRKIFTEKNKNGLIIIDYLQLMKSNLKLENRVQEISYITRNLKILAKEFEIPILVLSQLSRNVESRINKRPMLSDLRESGCLTKFSSKSFKFDESWNKISILNNRNIKFTFKGIKPTFQLTLENDVQLHLTANHKILSKKGWITFSQISVVTDLYVIIKKVHPKFNFPYQYLKIKKISYLGIMDVYDKTIEYYHNYMSKNIILHNSIEQDADIVILLYREDYYNENKGFDDQKQITEFIIAKHRNGPVGTAKLIFNSPTTSFLDLSE